MPRYDFRCRACGSTFEISRPMARSGEPALCPDGHDDTVRLLSTVAVTGGSAGSPAASRPSAWTREQGEHGSMIDQD
ncbi:zinc ribbon domain-containing protein [Streptosporangium sp. NPDC048865]|uniref:FmdB family zinc ribbon protein n=1 Tax=Streptosporangium sp. NPDC048865 TaxID=3155766 RepID=UPI00342D0B46